MFIFIFMMLLCSLSLHAGAGLRTPTQTRMNRCFQCPCWGSFLTPTYALGFPPVTRRALPCRREQVSRRPHGKIAHDGGFDVDCPYGAVMLLLIRQEAGAWKQANPDEPMFPISMLGFVPCPDLCALSCVCRNMRRRRAARFSSCPQGADRNEKNMGTS